MHLKDLGEVAYHDLNEEMVHVLRTKTQNLESDLYFRVLSAFFISQMASSMRVSIMTPHRGQIPINMFACGLMESGGGKGHSINVLEDHVVCEFKQKFMKHTYPAIAEQNIEAQAMQTAELCSTEMEEEKDKLTKEYLACGPMPYSFDSGSGPAWKQIRTKAQIAKIGSLNMICDEIGTNLIGNNELFAVNLEAYDVGKIKQKITKQSSDNKRGEERDDPVPANMLIFGTPTKLFNGGKEETEFYALLETGYARRLFFAFGSKTVAPEVTAEEIYDILTNRTIDQTVDSLALKFSHLADVENYDLCLEMSKHVALISIEYQLQCERKAEAMPKFETIRKAEMQHRYFKAIKLAGAYAFVDGARAISEYHMYAAIKLTEDSGKAFEHILSRDKNYARLAKYIAEVGKEVTHADLVEDLPFYSGSKAAKEDMLHLAVAWGHRHNIIIKRSVSDNIEFLKGESLKETDLEQMIVSYAQGNGPDHHPAHGYINTRAPFHKLHKLTQRDNIHWVNHFINNGHRTEENVIQGFNMLVLDVDGGMGIEVAKTLLQDFKALFYTTKRHRTTDPEKGYLGDRYRIVLPMTHELKMTSKEFKEFMDNVYEWLPFGTDEETNQRCKKWQAHAAGEYFYTDGQLFDPLPFIPKTAKNQERVNQSKQLGNLGKMEQWFATEWQNGTGRNNTLIKYALMLLDSGMDAAEVKEKTIEFNDKMPDPMSLDEIEQTVIRSVFKKQRDKEKE